MTLERETAADRGPLPELLLAFYGDDFTGSTDAMEVMAAAGLSTALFLDAPTAEQLARFKGLRCIGVAGQSRGRSPAWMDRHLPPVFSALAALRPAVLQYKVCSTFDSSPEVGSIGRAIDLGAAAMASPWVPVLVGAPRLRRYQSFGHLFAAAADGQVYRLDRHPTMSRHPVTPMAESDLRRHLAQQTQRPIALIDLNALDQGLGAQQLAQVRASEPAPAVFIDVADTHSQRAAGELVWAHRGAGLFSASSSGLGYALVAHWRASGLLPAPAALPAAAPVPAIAAVSGSCSPVTAGQIRWAREHGFETLRLDLERALCPATAADEVARQVQAAASALAQGRSVVVFSAEGPEDSAVLDFDRIAARQNLSRADAAQATGLRLADVMAELLDRVPLTRIAVAGGDSSGEVVSRMGVQALSVAAALAPGAPLCRAWSDNPRRDGLELVLKGGQMGAPSFFGDVRSGQVAR